MKSPVRIGVLVATLLGLASVLALPADLDTGIFERDHALANTYAKANLSSLFGWQLTGSRMTETELWAGCFDVSTKWKALGLDADSIKAPLCNLSTSYIAPKSVVPYMVEYTTSVFISQLLSTFNNTDAFAHVCDQIGFNMVSSFGINDLTIVHAVCKAGGVQTKPRPEKSLPWATESAVHAARNTASILFSIIWATAATSNSQLSTACARAPDYISYLNKERLNGTLVQSTLCTIKKPISVHNARDMVRTWMSRYFTTVIESISHNDGWLDWLCENIDSDMLDSAGLNGYGIQSQICKDSAEYSE